MHSIRFSKAYYFAAFFLGAVIALLVVAPVRGADSPNSDHFERAPVDSGKNATRA